MITFRGGALDGEVHPIAAEDLSADWSPDQEVYVVSDQEGEHRGIICSAPLPKNPYRTPRRISLALALSSLPLNAAAYFLDAQGRAMVLSFALILLWIAFWIKP